MIETDECGVITSMIARPSGWLKMGKYSRDQREDPEMPYEGSLDLHAGSPGVASWARLHMAFVDREGPAYVGEDTNTMFVPGARGQRFCVCQRGCAMYGYSACYTRKKSFLCDQSFKEWNFLTEGLPPSKMCSLIR